MSTFDLYIALNKKLHKYQHYGRGHRNVKPKLIKQLLQAHEAKTVLDYGCGKGGMLKHLTKDFVVEGYDPAIVHFERRPHHLFDAVICLDVLEHIHQNDLPQVLMDIHRYATKLIVLSISTRPSSRTMANGENAHVTVKPDNWWIDLISALYPDFLLDSTTGKDRVLVVGVKKSK